MRGMRNTLSVLLLLAVVAALVFAWAMPVVAGGPATVVNSSWTWKAPTIDGVIEPSEWGSATVVDLSGLPGNTLEAYLYVMNDAQWIYRMLDVPGDTAGGAQFGFCENNVIVCILGSSTLSLPPGKGFGTSPMSSTPHVIFELAPLPLVFSPPGGYCSYYTGIAYMDVYPGGLSAAWPTTYSGVCTGSETGEVLPASPPPTPNVPATSLWGTVGMTVAMSGLVVWRLRRRGSVAR